MSQGIGNTTVAFARRASTGKLVALVSLAAGLIAGSAVVFAADTPPTSRFNENEMLDAARRAAGPSEGRPVNIGLPPPDELRVLEARREAELKRLSDKLKRAADARGPLPKEVVTAPAWTTEVTAAGADSASPDPDLQKQRSALGAHSDRGSVASSPDFGLKGTATVLMVLTGTDGRSSGPDRAADPILCVADGCYVSNGAQAQAAFHSFGQSLNLTGRIGRGAGACNHARTCVFRGVELGTSASLIQPIDLKFVRHDRREQREVTIDHSCKVIEGRLSCSRPVRAATYTLWIVPEHVAREIGSDALVNAVGDGLMTARTAELPWATETKQ